MFMIARIVNVRATTTNHGPTRMAQSNTRKRKHPADRVEDGRAIKHRASQACQSCRTRKVRCDVLANCSRCTNCRLDRTECVVVASRRGKNNHTRRDDAAQTQSRPPPSAEAASESSPVSTTNDACIVPNGSAGPVPACVSFDDNLDNVASGQPPMRDEATGSATELSPSTPYVGLLTPETRPDNFQPQQSPAEKAAFPAFIAPPSSHIPPEDLDYLARKGAFTVPEPDLRVEILRAYLFSVHPFMPMLDYRAFVHAVLNQPEDNRISLLLFQAVMFAGLHSLQLPVIQRLGFESTKQARGVFFSRVRLLLEFDVEPDIAAVLQSLVLMSSWYSKWDGRRDTWHWTGLAYDVARTMGLHREPTTGYASNKVRRFRRRLWWSLYIRDRMIALGTRRPMRIHDAEFDVAMLTLEDFDLEPFEECYQGQPLIPDSKENKATALMCIQLAKLGIYAGHVVSSQYTTLRTQPDQEIPHTVMVVSRRDEGRAEELESCNRELKEWFKALNTTVRPTASPTTLAGTHSCSEVHWAMLNVTYQTAVNVLHRTQALEPVPDAATEAPTVQNSSRSKVKESARSLTKLSQAMLHRDQLRFFGLIGVTAIIAAYLSHMLDITSADEDVRDACTFRLHQSLEVLQSFREIYASADAAVSFLASVSRKAGISLPRQVSGPAADPTSSSAAGFVMPAPNGRQVTGLKHTPGLSTAAQSDAYQLGWHSISPYHIVTPLANTRQPQSLLDRDRQVLPTSSMIQSNQFAASNNARVSNPGTTITPTRQHSTPQFVETTAFESLPNSISDGPFFNCNWDNGMDSSMNLEPMLSFNYDFYADAFGFSDGHLQGM